MVGSVLLFGSLFLLFYLTFYLWSLKLWVIKYFLCLSLNSISNRPTNRTSISKSNTAKEKKATDIFHPNPSKYILERLRPTITRKSEFSHSNLDLNPCFFCLFSGCRTRETFSQAKIFGIGWTSCIGSWSENDWCSSQNLVPKSSHQMEVNHLQSCP